MGKRALLVAAMLACGSVSAIAAEGFDWGGDFRFRVTDLGDIPSNGPVFDQLFNRNRTRVWFNYGFNEDTSVRLRLTNEFRFYDDGRQTIDRWDPLNEIVPDHIYADFNNLGDGKFSLRIGRQDLIYGTGKIILDGTPLDGSRTIYHNAIKASLKLDKHQIDFLGIYNEGKDSLAININREQDIRVIEQDEAALGIYGKYNRFDQAPFEYYWVYKHEDDSRTSYGAREDADFHTFGLRVMPKFGHGFSANVEAAVQTGDHGDEDVEGGLFDGVLKFSPNIWGSTKPTFSAGYYFLTGNEAGTGDNEGWHPVFSRWPQISELYLYSYVGTQYSVGGWSNLRAPYIGLDLLAFKDGNFSLRWYKMYADERDGPGDGDERGDLVTATLKFKVTKNFSGHVRGEWLGAGNYYAPGTDDGTFLRLNLEYKF